jgi:TrmH family RNA methyltransferase
MDDGRAGSPALAARHPDVKALRRLARRRSARQDADRYVIDGPRLVIEALAAGIDIDTVYVPVDGVGPDVDALLAAARDAGVPVLRLAPGVLESVAGTVHPQPAIAVARPNPADLDTVLGSTAGPGPGAATRAAAPPAPLILVLHDVSDPGNAGTLLRVAEAAGVTGVVVCGPHAVDVYNPKVVRAAAGSLFRMSVATCDDAAALLDALGAGGIPLAATVATGGVAYDRVDLSGPVALAIGSEAHGLPTHLVERAQLRLTIPMAGRVESLNAGVAGALVCFEAARQRRARGGEGR